MNKKEIETGNLKEKINLKYKIMEYKNCKNKTHLLIGITILIGLLPIPSLLKIINMISIKAFIISISTIGMISLYGTTKTYKHFKNKIKKLKIDNPTINFDNITNQNLKELSKEIEKLNNKAIHDKQTKESLKKEEIRPKLYQNIPPIHTQSPNSKGHVKSIGTLKRRG